MSANTKNNELEVLRAIGILFVVIAHFSVFMPWNPPWQHFLYSHLQFWSGVDLFFAVSGFVITRSLLPVIAEYESGAFWRQVGAFWVRRFYRLIPASWFWLAISVMLSIFFNRMGTFGSPAYNIVDAVSQFFYLANWHSYFCNNGWGACGANSIYWSLSLEEQFYFILPLAIFFLRRRIVWFCAALIVLQFGIFRPVFSALWLTRVDAVSWGVLIALFSESELYQHLKPVALRSTPFRLLVTGMLVFALAVLAAGEIFPFYTGAIALCTAMMVWLASYNDGIMFRYVRNSRFLLWVGSRSYSIYLSHALAFFFVIEYCKLRSGAPVAPNDTFRILAGGLILTVLCAEFSYRFIEAPFRLRGRSIAIRMASPTKIEVKRYEADASTVSADHPSILS
jgi:peptidoglycan/LPS O-acetylase OafA/YrhL